MVAAENKPRKQIVHEKYTASNLSAKTIPPLKLRVKYTISKVVLVNTENSVAFVHRKNRNYNIRDKRVYQR